MVDVQTCTREELKYCISSLKYTKMSMGSLPWVIATNELQGIKYCIEQATPCDENQGFHQDGTNGERT